MCARIGIYKITNPKGKIYIGQSYDIEKRWLAYKTLCCKQQPKIYNSLKKYGPENHIFEVIEECTKELLNEREIYYKKDYINILNNDWSNVLFCHIIDGAGGYKSEETRDKISESLKGRSNYWLKGKSITKDHKLKISQKKKGHKMYNDIWKLNHYLSTRNKKGKSRNCHIESVIKAKSKHIYQYDINFNFIKEWQSAAVAAKQLNLWQPNIDKAVKGKVKTCGGFIWKYKN